MIRPVLQTRQSGQILILLLGSLLLGGSALLGVGVFATGRSVGEIEDRIDDVVGDKGRRKAAEKLLDAWEKDGERFLEQNAERREELLEKLERHETQPAELRTLFGGMQEANQEIQARVLERRFALKELLTREEWERVFPR